MIQEAAERHEEDDAGPLDELIDNFYKENSCSKTENSAISPPASRPGRYEVLHEFPNVKALTISEGRLCFELNCGVFCGGGFFQVHGPATAANCFGLEVMQFVDMLLNNLHVPFWAIEVRPGMEVVGYMLQRPFPIKWNLVHKGEVLRLSSTSVVSAGFGKYILKALEKWLVSYDSAQRELAPL